MQKRTFLLVGVLGASGLWRHALATPPRLRYGGDAAFAPFESLDAKGQPQGFLIDLLKELEVTTGRGIDIALGPWSKTEADFRAGQLDVIAMVDTSARHEWAQFTRGIASPAFGMYRRSGTPEPQGLRGLDGLRIAVLDTEPTRDTIATWLSGLPGPLVRVPDAAAALDDVAQKRADIALLTRAYGDPALAARPEAGIVLSHPNLTLQTYALAVAPGNTELAAELQRGLDALEANGKLEALRVRWLNSHRDVAERKHLEQDLDSERKWNWNLVAASASALLALGATVVQRTRRVKLERRRRERAEAALENAQQLLDKTFENRSVAMLIVESGTRVVRDANAAMRALIGVPAERLVGTSLNDMRQHIDADALRQLVDSLAADGVLDAAPLQLKRADGAMRDCLVSAERFVIDEVAHVFCIIRDITDQLAADTALRRSYHEMAAELAQSRQALQDARVEQAQAERSMEEYTRSISHDLKTPINAIHGFNGLLRQRLQAGKFEEALGFTERIDGAVRRMTAMIGALSRLSQISRHPLQRQTLDMQRMVEDTWAMLLAAHPARKTEFRIESLPPAHGDPELVVQVWQNILDNASKYSARVDAPTVKVDSYQDDRGVWYRVTDNGAGFDMASAKTLFQPFQRMHTAKEFEGTGVGLSVVRRILDHHGGEVRLRSARGVGTVAEFTLDSARK